MPWNRQNTDCNTEWAERDQKAADMKLIWRAPFLRYALPNIFLSRFGFRRYFSRIPLFKRGRRSPCSVDTDVDVLFVTSNGAGLGHLTRVSAIQKELGARSKIYTLSSGFKKLDLPPDDLIYFPSYGTLGMGKEEWNAALTDHFGAILKVYKPKVVVFDGTFIYHGVYSQCFQNRTTLVWMRRGCWKEEVATSSDQYRNPHRYCDEVVVPGDYGEKRVELDSCRVPAAFFDPVIVSSPSAQYDRQTAKNELGLDADKKYVLIQLGAGNINDIQCDISVILDQLSGTGFYPVMLNNPVSNSEATGVGDIVIINKYPISPFYKAFDAVVMAAGYNSVQEAVSHRLNALLIPNLDTATDDQLRRAINSSKFEGIDYVDSKDNLREKLCSLLRQAELDPQQSDTVVNPIPEPRGAYQIARYIENVILGMSN